MSLSVLEAPATDSADNYKLAPRPTTLKHTEVEHTSHAEALELKAASLAAGGDLVVLYGKNPCPNCDNTLRSLIKHGVPFIKVDILKDSEGLEYILRLGVQQVPYVETARGDSWRGHLINKLMEHRHGLAALAAA